MLRPTTSGQPSQEHARCHKSIPTGADRGAAARPDDRPSRPPLRGRAVGHPDRRPRSCSIQPLGVLLAFLSIGVSGAFGLKYSIYGAIWRRIVKVAHLGPTEMEHEYPPRFAQVFGSVVLAVALLAFLVGLPVVWLAPRGAVAALQTVLAVTGYCLGCRLYFLRWWVPSQVTRLWPRGIVEPRTPLRYS